MRILYVGTERPEAQAIATAVNSLGERVTVSWTSSLDRVANWIDENDGIRVLVVEAQPNGLVWRSVLNYAAGLPTALPVVVIVPEKIASDLEPLGLDAHVCLARSPSLLRDLPAAIARAIDQAQLRQLERAGRADLELKLAQAAEQLARSQAQYEMGMARAAATRDMVNEQFREAGIEVERIRLRHAAAVADAERLARREAELSLQLDSAATTRGVLERRLADLETALHAGEERAAEERRSVAELVAERQREFERKIQRHTSAMTAAGIQSRELRASLNAGRHELESKAAHLAALASREAELTSMLAAATERRAELEEQIQKERAARAALEEQIADAGTALAARQAQLGRERAEAEAKRDDLTAQLGEVEEARDRARREHQSAVADITRLKDREAELDEQVRQAGVARAALEKEIADAHFALRDEQQRHDAALAMAASQLAERQAQFDRERAEAEATRGGLSTQLREVEEARDLARREHQSVVADVTRLTEREAELEGRLKVERVTRDVIEQDAAGAAAAFRDEQERHHAALATAAAELAERQAHFEGERARAEAERAVLTAQLREMEEARDQARREHQSVASDLTRVTEHAAAEREAAARCQTDLEARMLRANEEIETLRAASVVQANQLEEQRREYQQLTAEHQAIERRFDEARNGFQESVDRLTTEHAAAVATRENDIERLRASLAASIEELEATRRQREVLRVDAAKLPGLLQELQKSRADNHRLFQQASLPMFRCTKDGVLTQANRLLMTLVGRRSPDELVGADWAAGVFESPKDLSWLIARCLGSRGKESIETTWRRKDGSRLLVRLSACATSSDLIEAGVEDLTPLRVLNDRLGQAHRMEAVGRLATEVAVTCGSLLDGVHQNAQQLLMTDGSNLASTHRGEMLLEEISRAGGLLRQLAAYGEEESRKPAMVELRTVVRDIAPVLKRVAGDGVEVQLPAASAPLNVDAGAERIQRLLVNLAAYGRERMPLGGQLKIELGTIVVDRHFTAKYPNVRLGPHALVTVTESRRATRTDGLPPLHENEAGSGSQSVAVQTRVDLGTLQELVGECGGHLWMTVEPAGDMVVKIRLPLVTAYGEQPRRPSALGGRVRTLGHWFQD